MRAAILYENCSPDELQVADSPDPNPGPTDVLVDVQYSGVDCEDFTRRVRDLSLANEEPPCIPGCEGAGTIAGVGRQVDPSYVGQRAAFLTRSGGHATRVCVPATQVVFGVPDEIRPSVAGGMMRVGLTAVRLSRLAGLRPKQSVLIHGGAGGVGSLLVQLCKLREASVLATVGSEAEVSLDPSKLGGEKGGPQ
jgi:NADPH:quinone reductase-like Zn-dependent oxidoreductase